MSPVIQFIVGSISCKSSTATQASILACHLQHFALGLLDGSSVVSLEALDFRFGRGLYTIAGDAAEKLGHFCPLGGGVVRLFSGRCAALR